MDVVRYQRVEETSVWFYGLMLNVMWQRNIQEVSPDSTEEHSM